MESNIIPFEDLNAACEWESDMDAVLTRVPGPDFWKSVIGKSQWAVFSNFECKLMGWEPDYRATGTVSKITIKDTDNMVVWVEINGYETVMPMNFSEITRRILDS